MITIGNNRFTLLIDENCKVKSLMLNNSNEELIMQGEDISFFSLTEERQFNNEIKLAFPNKRTTFEANRLRREGNRLIVGFEFLTFEAVVEIKETYGYVSFTLVDYIIQPDDFLNKFPMNAPPVLKFRLIQLPILNRKIFGEWLNVLWDNKIAVNVLSTSPYADIGSEKRKNYCIMYADASKDIKLKGCGAALIVCQSDEFLSCVENVENDFCLPKGVQSRLSPFMNKSIYWTMEINLQNAEKHIDFAKRGGFKMMLIYYPAFIRALGYQINGDYVFNDAYPGGFEDLKTVLSRIKGAGITPGFHFLHTHIGVKSSYVTPFADHRLNLAEYFTLARPLGTDDDVIYVEQNPEGTVMHPKCRVLKFDGELIYYEKYETQYPYRFIGCKRGYFNTNISPHSLGTIGGILDLSEFGAESVYIDQRTSLQDEIAEKIACIYNAGFEFVYFDGSEGTNPPYGFNIPYAQYRVYKRLEKSPIFCEGAAKAHFSWHMLSGGNAFDAFPMDVFKKKIAEYPLEEAPRMANDFTRINFGWWAFNSETQPDMYEYGTSKAAAFDCPTTVMLEIKNLENNARTDDILEVMSRWEDVRDRNILTDEQKEALKNPNIEYILLLNENNEYELTPYYQIKNAANGCATLRAFSFGRKGKRYVVCWCTTGSTTVALHLPSDSITCEKQLGGERISVDTDGEVSLIPISGRSYISSSTLSSEELIRAFEKAKLR